MYSTAKQKWENTILLVSNALKLMIKAEEHAEFSQHDQSGLVRLLIAAGARLILALFLIFI